MAWLEAATLDEQQTSHSKRSRHLTITQTFMAFDNIWQVLKVTLASSGVA